MEKKDYSVIAYIDLSVNILEEPVSNPVANHICSLSFSFLFFLCSLSVSLSLAGQTCTDWHMNIV